MMRTKFVPRFPCVFPFAFALGVSIEANTQEAERYRQDPVDITESEANFLNCALECAPNEFQCFSECQRNANLSPEEVAKVMSINIGTGVTEEECKAMAGFVCPSGTNICCCEGFFDCSKMEDVVKGCRIDFCDKSPGEPEVCSCKY